MEFLSWIFLALLLLLFYFVSHIFKFIYEWHRRTKLQKEELPKPTTTTKLTGWLNDEVINSFMDMIVERSQHDQSLPKVYAFNTFFYPKLCQMGYEGVERWTRKINIFDYQMLIVPIHLGNHWCMTMRKWPMVQLDFMPSYFHIIDFERRRMDYYDSMLGDNKQCMDTLRDYLIDESMERRQLPLDMSNWVITCRKDIPNQENFLDCGVFVCMFAEYASRRAPMTFNQRHIPYFREKIDYELSRKP